MSSITNSDSPLTELLTAEDIAAAAKVTTDRVWQMTREGILPTVKLGPRTYRYRPGAYERAIADMEE